MRRPSPSRVLALLPALPLLGYRALRAWYTLEPHDWSRLADCWQAVATALPDSLTALLLHARLLRSARRFPAALAAGEAALALAPEDGAVLLEHAKALRGAGRRAAAIAGFVAAWHHGEREAATRELCRYGARAALPEAEPGIAAPADYAIFAAANPVPLAPFAARKIVFRVTITGAEQDCAATRASLIEQAHPHWLVAQGESASSGKDAAVFELVLAAGTRLDPQALAWLAWAIDETDCHSVTADHDLLGTDGATRTNPTLLPSEDWLWKSSPDATNRIVAKRTDGAGPVVHVPLVLASCPAAPPRADGVMGREVAAANISIIIPTRDNPELLRAAIAALRETALAPERIELVIVDNGNRTIEAKALLAELAAQPGVSIVPFDAPFNWSRANNLGAAAARGELLVFLNDDTEMRTQGWDRLLAGLLADPRIGVVGARMLYPNGSIQHGGFVFGMDNGPQHEGRWMDGDDPGPSGRWLATRQAASVTGAFMAMRRSVYDEISGFDEATFAVDFADVDLCLRLRAHRLAVAYCGGITLLHHESISRGLNLSRAKRRRMRREAAALRLRWGAAVDDDPGYHPAWSRTGCSYDGLRAMTQTQVIEYVRRSIGANPWAIRAA